MSNEQESSDSFQSEKSSSEPSSADRISIESEKEAEKEKEPPKKLQDDDKNSSLELEILKNAVRTITANLNRFAAIPQKEVAVFGGTIAEKIKNLAAEALKTFTNAQEMPPKAAKLLKMAEEEEKEGSEMMDCFQAVAMITLSCNIEANRRAISANRGETEDNRSKINEEIVPRVKKLLRQVLNDQVFKSDAMCKFAALMEPTNTDNMAEGDLAALENDVGWIITQLWGKSAANLWQIIIAQCERRQEWNKRTGQRITILTHLWNLRFKAILAKPEKERSLHNAIERELCKAASEAMYGQLLQTLRNTRCIMAELVVNAARTAKSNLDAIFSAANPLSITLGNLLANADSNNEFSNWGAIRIIRSLWPKRDQIASSEYAILKLNDIDDRIEIGLQNPESLRNTSYEKYFIKRSYDSHENQGRKRKRTTASSWGEIMGRDSSFYEEGEGSWEL
ncbi:unnamed protein product [Oikopleura dioica]|uniref:Uncharacterized protein n=1 Tax=Oikopleura dioica TaxID=34765 RepID=E4Y4E6_OIKDI|nr:unnamed protein product [Oikopleura dioica]